MSKPRVNEDGQKEIEKLGEKFDNFVQNQKDFDPFEGLVNAKVSDPQSTISRKQAENANAPYIKPSRSVNRSNFKNDKTDSRTYFEEKHKEQHDRDWEYVKCIVENYELIGQEVEVWTAKWGCDPAHFWIVPVNKPVMIPRMLAEQLSKCKYHRLRTENSITGNHAMGQTFGTIVVDHVTHRIDARPVGFGF